MIYMNEIKVKNIRHEGGWLFHYAHFMCDLLLPEIIQKIYTYDVCYRQKNIHQSLGNFHSLWERIMDTKTIELSDEEFKQMNVPILPISRFNQQCKNAYGKKEIDTFRSYMFKRFNIQPDPTYPEIILIERGVNKHLINPQDFSKDLKPGLLQTGKERREIKHIHILKKILHHNKVPYKCIVLEHMDIREQIKYFNNAKIIIGSHGAAMSNLLFCNPNTFMIEVGGNWNFFNVIMNVLSIKNIKCVNELHVIIPIIKKVYDEFLNQKNQIKNSKNRFQKLLFQ
jgi:Glycosyltransferase 61